MNKDKETFICKLVKLPANKWATLTRLAKEVMNVDIDISKDSFESMYRFVNSWTAIKQLNFNVLLKKLSINKKDLLFKMFLEHYGLSLIEFEGEVTLLLNNDSLLHKRIKNLLYIKSNDNFDRFYNTKTEPKPSQYDIDELEQESFDEIEEEIGVSSNSTEDVEQVEEVEQELIPVEISNVRESLPTESKDTTFDSIDQ